jgi:hypothetical protein
MEVIIAVSVASAAILAQDSIASYAQIALNKK